MKQIECKNCHHRIVEGEETIIMMQMLENPIFIDRLNIAINEFTEYIKSMNEARG